MTKTRIYRWYAQMIIKCSVNKYKKADYCIFTCYDFYNKYNHIPTLLFCDWDYETFLKRQEREPSLWDKKFINQQKEAIQSAQYVISLFPDSAKKIEKHFNVSHVHYLGGNVINCIYDGVLFLHEIVAKKKKARTILFVGDKKYIESARILLKSFALLKEKILHISLHIIGIGRNEMNNIPENVYLHGYLDKGNDTQCRLYYELMKEATVIVNPNPEWGGFSSIVEAMYFYTPVVVAPYIDFVETFGRNINFGIYSNIYEERAIAQNVETILCSRDYDSLCFNAHEQVKGFTWSAYIDNLLNLVAKE